MQISSLLVLIIFCTLSQTTISVAGRSDQVNPGFLWAAVNSSLTEKKAPKHCPKLVFFNRKELGNQEIAKDQRGIVSNSFIDIEETILNSNYAQWGEAELNLKEATAKSIAEKLEPCVTVVSFVLNSTQYNLTQDNVRHLMSHHMVDLLQHSTPIRSRHLVIIRLSDNLDDFRFCGKAAKYPIRLVPDWEILLFDFFTDVRAIQGMFKESGEQRHPYVRITKENGRWKWLCEDIIANLEMEKSCNHVLDQKCLEANPKLQIWKPGSVPRSCEGGFRPRH